jgi:hypothetical protein
MSVGQRTEETDRLGDRILEVDERGELRNITKAELRPAQVFPTPFLWSVSLCTLPG